MSPFRVSCDDSVIDGHPIPPELICQGVLYYIHVLGHDSGCLTVFKFAAREPSMALTLCLVCRTAVGYILPELYRHVTLSSASQIIAFHGALYRSQMGTVGQSFLPRDGTLPSIVRTLWLGPKSCNEMRGLGYSSTSWPITIIHHIFSICHNLRSVAMVNLGQNMLFRLERIIPPSVETLYLGPIHGSLSLKTMQCNPHSIVSAETYMPDWEVKDIVTSPHCRRFCRFLRWSTHVEFALKQLECVAQAGELRDMQIVIFGHGDFERNVAAMVSEYAQFLNDRRISIICRPSTHRDWMECLYNQWMTES